MHGREVAAEAERRSREVFSGGLLSLDEAGFVAAIAELPRATLASSTALTAAGTAIAAGAVSSNGEARRLIAQGGLYVNDRRVAAPDDPLPDPVHGRFWVVRTGKKNVRIVELGG